MIGHIQGQKLRRQMGNPSGNVKRVLGTKIASPCGHFPSGDAVFVLGTHQTSSLRDTKRHKIGIRQRLMCVARWTPLMRRTYLLLYATRARCRHALRARSGARPVVLTLLPAEPPAARQPAQPWRRSGTTGRWPPRCPEVARSRALAIRAAPAPKRARAFRMAKIGRAFLCFTPGKEESKSPRGARSRYAGNRTMSRIGAGG